MMGLIAFSFGLTENEPSACNRRLAEAVVRIVGQQDGPVSIVAQWEVARALAELGLACDHVVHRNKSGDYLDSTQVVREGVSFFHGKPIERVIPVAQRGVYLWYCAWLIWRAAYKPTIRKIGKVGFVPDSVQWWTRGPLRFCLGVVLKLLHRLDQKGA